MTDEPQNISTWPNALLSLRDEHAIYSRISDRRRRALSSFFPGAIFQEGTNANGSTGSGVGGGADELNDEMPTWQKWFTFILLPVIIALLWYCLYNNSLVSPYRIYLPACNATFENLERAFPSQPAHVWTAIQKVKQTASKGRTPGVLTILANAADKHLLNQFALSVAYALGNSQSPVWNVININGSEISMIASPKKSLMLTFFKEKKFVAIVNDLDKMNASFVSLFHSLTDELTWFNGSMFIFTVTSLENVEELSRDKCAITAEQVLIKAWKDQLPLHYRSALVARLTGNTLVVKREQSFNQT